MNEDFNFPLAGLNVHEHIQIVLPEHIDALGHVNHATFLEMFEIARWDMLKAHGITLEDIKSSQLGPVILEVRIKYHKELRKDDRFLVRSWAKKKSGKIGLIHQKMFSPDQTTLHAEVNLVYGLLDMKRRKLAHFPQEWTGFFS